MEDGVEADQVFCAGQRPPPAGRGVELPDDEDAAGSESAGGLPEEGLLVADVVERVGHDHCVDRRGPNRQVRPVGPDGPVPVRPCPADHPGRRVDDHADRRIDRFQGSAWPTADVQNSLDGPCRRLETLVEFLPVDAGHTEVVEGGKPVEGPDVAVHTSKSPSGGKTPLFPPARRRVHWSPPRQPGMEFALLGWPSDGPTLHLDYEAFAYAGKFVMSSTGKAVAREEDVVGAVAFDEDRTDPDCLQLRYVTVRRDRRGEGIGPRLLRFTAERARERRYGSVEIAANNPFAYEACYRAGFVFTGDQTGLAELVLRYRPDADPEAGNYQDGLDRYRERDLSPEEESFLSGRRGQAPPEVVVDPGQD